MNNMLDNNEESPVVEKVSLNDINQEKMNQDAEENSAVNNLYNAMMALNEEEIKKAIAYVKSRLDILNKHK